MDDIKKFLINLFENKYPYLYNKFNSNEIRFYDLNKLYCGNYITFDRRYNILWFDYKIWKDIESLDSYNNLKEIISNELKNITLFRFLKIENIQVKYKKHFINHQFPEFEDVEEFKKKFGMFLREDKLKRICNGK